VSLIARALRNALLSRRRKAKIAELESKNDKVQFILVLQQRDLEDQNTEIQEQEQERDCLMFKLASAMKPLSDGLFDIGQKRVEIEKIEDGIETSIKTLYDGLTIRAVGALSLVLSGVVSAEEVVCLGI
jgi:hypothetical protein